MREREERERDGHTGRQTDKDEMTSWKDKTKIIYIHYVHDIVQKLI